MRNRITKTRNIIGIVLVGFIGLVVWSMISTVTAESKSKYKHLGIAEYEKGNYQEAIKYYARGLEANPKDACLYNNQGLAYYCLEKSDEALSNYNKAIELKPDFAKAYFNRGLTYLKKGSYYKTEPYKKSISDFTKAIELKPDFADAYYNRAMTYTKYVHYHHKYKTLPPKFPAQDVEYYNKALADFDKALELDPSYALAHVGKGELIYRYEDWEKADKEYVKALEHKKEILEKLGKEGLADVYTARTRNLLAWGKYEEIISVYTTALEYYKEAAANKEKALSNNFARALGGRMGAAKKLGRWEDAIKDADDVIALKESNPKKFGNTTYNYFGRGQCYYHLGRYDEAIPDFEKALERKGGYAYGRSMLWLGRTYKAKGNKEKANEELENALKLFNKGVETKEESGLHSAYLIRGICYLELDEYDKAISDFEETIKRKVRADRPVDHTNYWLDAHKHTGIAYMNAGNRDKAKEYFEKTIELAKKRGFHEVVKETKELLTKL